MDKTPPRWLMRLQWRAHRLVWDLSGGRLTNRVGGLPIHELETTGHRSGAPRSILISCVDTPPGPVLAGSNAAADHDPAWVKNLRAAPRARVREAGEWREVRAVSSTERNGRASGSSSCDIRATQAMSG
ncbi:MAG TPA: nitroreductase family deazaflavin-dependent oxidoreductase [Acidimicrobiia bacterium]|nr:nitroreductase family deazaflavin-dependent oxidoreductase [Acidimicrobiia bacterium]